VLPSASPPEDLAALSQGLLRNWAGAVVGATHLQVRLERA
jgi:hypothetical protein